MMVDNRVFAGPFFLHPPLGMAPKVLEKLGGIAKSVLGTANERILRNMYPLVQRINALEPEFQRKPDAELRALTDRLRERLRGPKSFQEKQEALNEVLPEAFANLVTTAKSAK